MEKGLTVLFIFLTTLTFGQGRKAGTSTKNAETSASQHRAVVNEPYFDYYQDFQKYATGKESKYKELYQKYTQVDSLPIYYPMTKESTEYPSPCYVVTDDGRVKTGMAYHYTFLQQLFYKRLSCLKDGSALDPQFMKYQAYDYLRAETTKEAIKLLIQYDNKPLSENELDILFEKAKSLFKEGAYPQSNAVFSFLASVNEAYREAAINNIGLSFYHKKEYQRAFDYFQRAIDLYPRGYLGYLNAGACKTYLTVDMGDQNVSIYYFKKAFELAPDNPNVISNYKNAMKQYLRQQEVEMAEKK